MSYLDRIDECNRPMPGRVVPFSVAGVEYGGILETYLPEIRRYPEVFSIGEGGVSMRPALVTRQARTEALARAASDLYERGVIPRWLQEPFAVKNAFLESPVMDLERAAVPFFGVRGFGVHLNGVVHRDGKTLMWVARRAADKHSFPGMLDNLVAGGIPSGLGVRETLVKECAEEAGIGADMAGRARPVGLISYVQGTPLGRRPDLIYVYDLALPEDFQPRPIDGENESFELLDIETVAHMVRDTREFKFNCNLVIIDYLVRAGSIDVRTAGYEAIVHGLRRAAPRC